MTADYDRAVVEHVIDLWEDSGGALVASVEMVPGDGFLLIENIAVRPDRQGEGFGAMVLRHAESLARDLGLPEIRLYTNARFVSNIDFYARRGFREFRREELVPGNVAVHMSKRTDPSG